MSTNIHCYAYQQLYDKNGKPIKKDSVQIPLYQTPTNDSYEIFVEGSPESTMRNYFKWAESSGYGEGNKKVKSEISRLENLGYEISWKMW